MIAEALSRSLSADSTFSIFWQEAPGCSAIYSDVSREFLRFDFLSGNYLRDSRLKR